MSKHTFAQVPKAQIPRSSFDRSFSHKTTFNAGKLVPVFCEEVLPGDTFNVRVNLFCRLTSPLTVPIMDDMFVDMQFFFVPSRLLWDNWQKFNGEQRNPGDSTDFLIPRIEVSFDTADPDGVGIVSPQSLGDYLGLPLSLPSGTSSYYVNALPFRAYNLVWNEWYRDQNLQNSVDTHTGDVDQVLVDYSLLPRGKRHDYFTSCLPWPQKGPGVELPLGTSAPVIGNGMTLGLDNGTTGYGLFFKTSENDLRASSSDFGTPVGSTPGSIVIPGLKTLGVTSDPEKSGLIADLSNATAATINSLRQAFQLQRLFERDARGGTRYTEILRAHFGVISPDARLQRPEYLGGFSRPININPVSQTSETADTPLANLAAYAMVGDSQSGFVKSFVEHGYILGLASVRARYNYQQGLNRMWSRRSRFDFYWPALAHLGEQAVLNKEIFLDATPADDAVFGYQERWAEYRYAPGRISGYMRSTASTPLDIWHLAQKFENRPVLNSEFIVENPPIDRVTAIHTEETPNFLCDLYFDQKTVRPMPVYSVPGLIDHF